MQPLSRLRTAMAKSEIGALLVSDIVNVGWLTGFTGTYGRAVITQDQAVFITDGRYTLQAGEEVTNMPCVSFSSPVDGDEFLAQKV